MAAFYNAQAMNETIGVFLCCCKCIYWSPSLAKDLFGPQFLIHLLFRWLCVPLPMYLQSYIYIYIYIHTCVWCVNEECVSACDCACVYVRLKLFLIIYLQVLCVFAAGFSPASNESGSSGGSESGDGERQCSVEAVGFSPLLPVAVTGSLSGVVGVWDFPTQKLRQKCSHEVIVWYGRKWLTELNLAYVCYLVIFLVKRNQDECAGVVRLCCSNESPVVYSGGLDGVVRGWDLRSGQLIQKWYGPGGTILDMILLQ